MKENEGQSFTELIVVYVITEEWGNQTRQPQRLNRFIGKVLLPTFRTKLSVPSSRVKQRKKKMGPTACPETSKTNHHSTLRHVTEERRSHLHGGRGGKLKMKHKHSKCSGTINFTPGIEPAHQSSEAGE